VSECTRGKAAVAIESKLLTYCHLHIFKVSKTCHNKMTMWSEESKRKKRKACDHDLRETSSVLQKKQKRTLFVVSVDDSSLVRSPYTGLDCLCVVFKCYLFAQTM